MGVLDWGSYQLSVVSYQFSGARDGFVLSHLSRKGRGKDGAPGD